MVGWNLVICGWWWPSLGDGHISAVPNLRVGPPTLPHPTPEELLLSQPIKLAFWRDIWRQKLSITVNFWPLMKQIQSLHKIRPKTHHIGAIFGAENHQIAQQNLYDFDLAKLQHHHPTRLISIVSKPIKIYSKKILDKKCRAKKISWSKKKIRSMLM